MASRGRYEHEHTRRWSELVRSYDGFVFVFPQYNWGYPAVLKNALDFVYHEWTDKRAGLVTYGTRGGGLAATQLSQVLQGLRMRAVETTIELKTDEAMLADDGTFHDADAVFAEYLDQVIALGNELKQLASIDDEAHSPRFRSTRRNTQGDIMIVLTTPTGNVGSQLLANLLDATSEPLRVVARDPSGLSDAMRDRVEVVVGSHDDPAVLDHALDGADAMFWLIPPTMRANSAEEYYLSFTRPAAEAVRRHHVGHVVGASSAGWDWPHPAGLLSAAHTMDTELERSGAAYRSLGMGFYMENLIRPLPQMLSDGLLSLPLLPDRPVATIATRDIAATAARLLTDRTWDGTARIPIFGPDHLTPNQMAATISEVLGSQVRFEQADLEQQSASMVQRGVPKGMAEDFVGMYRAQQNGIYDDDWSRVTPTSTSFRTWCQTVLAAEARGIQRDLP